MQTLKSMLRDNRVLVGLTTQHVTTPWLAKLYRHAGADFVYVEYEHGFMNEADLANHVLACRSVPAPTILPCQARWLTRPRPRPPSPC